MRKRSGQRRPPFDLGGGDGLGGVGLGGAGLGGDGLGGFGLDGGGCSGFGGAGPGEAEATAETARTKAAQEEGEHGDKEVDDSLNPESEKVLSLTPTGTQLPTTNEPFGFRHRSVPASNRPVPLGPEENRTLEPEHGANVRAYVRHSVPLDRVNTAGVVSRSGGG